MFSTSRLTDLLNSILTKKALELGSQTFSTEALYTILNVCLYKLISPQPLSQKILEYAQYDSVTIDLTSSLLSISIPPYQLRKSHINPEELCFIISDKKLGEGVYGTVEEQEISIKLKFNKQEKRVHILEIKYNNKKAGKKIFPESSNLRKGTVLLPEIIKEAELIQATSIYPSQKTRLYCNNEYSYLSMPKIPHSPLSNVQRTPEIKWYGLTYSFLEAVAELHRKNIIHHDLKAANVMLDSSTFLTILLDFGLSYLYPTNIPKPRVPGSPIFFPPEKFLEWTHLKSKNDDIDYLKRSESYTLALLLYLLFLNEHADSAAEYLLKKIETLDIDKIKVILTNPSLSERTKNIQVIIIFSQNEALFLEVWNKIFKDLSTGHTQNNAPAPVPGEIITLLKKMVQFNNADRLTPEQMLIEFCFSVTMPILQDLKEILIAVITTLEADLITIKQTIKTTIEMHTLQLKELEQSFFNILTGCISELLVDYLSTDYELRNNTLNNRIQKLENLEIKALNNIQQLESLLADVNNYISQMRALSSDEMGALFKRLYSITQVQKVEVPITIIPPLIPQQMKPLADPALQALRSNSFLAVRAPLKPIKNISPVSQMRPA